MQNHISKNNITIAPSILSADFGRLNEEIKAITLAGADLIHADVMDGHFVPNMTFGATILQCMHTTLPLDIHLMVQNTAFFIDHFAPLKPKYISFHLEHEAHPHRLIQQIKSYGISPAIALNPHTPLNMLEYLLPDLDMVLIMSVNPGFGGQIFLPLALKKIKQLKTIIETYNPHCLIEIDGGVNDSNIKEIKEAGANIIVAGSYIFNSKDYLQTINVLRNA